MPASPGEVQHGGGGKIKPRRKSEREDSDVEDHNDSYKVGIHHACKPKNRNIVG